MGKREKKTGKGRLDKYYKLAKEQGYRARSAFKLIQLDKKFEILKNARCLIDLCAAPGGWLQVATKYMPPNSIILGVDLVPIKPIPRVITAAQDITTDKCRKWLREEMRDWKADVVLHDGAPNVGTAWAQDAFTQSELVLSSMKLAVEFLTPGGTFVTKVFRSKDYNSLLWVFNQLFSKVEATKPPSSRNVSAEIFVVCSGFLAPKRIDPKLLNPTHVFKDLDAVDSLAAQAENAESNKNAGSLKMDKLTPAAFNVFHPDKKRRAREGYDEGDYTLFKQTAVMDFIKSHDPIAVLGSVNQLRFTTDEEKAMLKSEATTGDIVSSCEDLKVLGKRDFKALLKWRGQMRDEFGHSVKSKEADEFTENAEVSAMPELDEEEQMALDIERMETEDTQSKKKAKRRANERKTRDIQRMQLHMTTPMDIGLERQDGYAGDEQDYVFDLNEVEGHGGRTQRVKLQGNEADDSDYDEDEVISEDEDANAAYESDEEDARYRDLESNLDQLYDEYQNTKLEKDAKHKVKEARKKRDAQAGQAGEWGGIGKKGKKSGSDAEEGSGGDDDDQEDSEDDQADTMAYFDEDGIPADEGGAEGNAASVSAAQAAKNRKGKGKAVDGNGDSEMADASSATASTSENTATSATSTAIPAQAPAKGTLAKALASAASAASKALPSALKDKNNPPSARRSTSPIVARKTSSTKDGSRGAGEKTRPRSTSPSTLATLRGVHFCFHCLQGLAFAYCVWQS